MIHKYKYYLGLLLIATLFGACNNNKQKSNTTTNTEEEQVTAISKLKVASNGHYFATEDDKPFFWMGDTAWLLFAKLTREEIIEYLDNRKQNGFNVAQVMVLHTLSAVNVYGDSALVKQNIAKPVITPGSDFSDEKAYDFWDHVDFAVNAAKERGIYMALVPVWGNNVKDGKVTVAEAKTYSQFLADRYKDAENVIWLNGGDTFGNEYTDVWNTIGYTLKENNPDKLITFHPRGRMQSSDWFEDEGWLDFNMVQSGHRRYDQDDTNRGYGEDNWRYMLSDFNLKPAKPTLDGEPSYEGIPQGLHDTLQPFWKAKDVRRYGYWSVFAGAAGYTYGHSAVMQMHRKIDKGGAYGNKIYWKDALNAEGATQMKYLKKLMLAYPYFNRVPDTSLVKNEGDKYNYIAATRGTDYALFYDYTGKPFEVVMGKIKGKQVTAYWFNPRNGEKTTLGTFDNTGIKQFKPTEEQEDGNDWVLILTSKS